MSEHRRLRRLKKRMTKAKLIARKERIAWRKKVNDSNK